MSDDRIETLRADNQRLREENARLRDEVQRLRDELYRLGRYLAPPSASSQPAAEGAREIEWAYWRGDLEDDLGDD